MKLPKANNYKEEEERITLRPLTERRPLRMHSLRPVPSTITSYSSSIVSQTNKNSAWFSHNNSNEIGFNFVHESWNKSSATSNKLTEMEKNSFFSWFYKPGSADVFDVWFQRVELIYIYIYILINFF